MSGSDTAHDGQVAPQAHYDGPIDEDSLHHYYCCNKNLSLCLSDVTGVPTDNDPKPTELCAVCRELHEVDDPCGAPFCRVRKPIRRLFGR